MKKSILATLFCTILLFTYSFSQVGIQNRFPATNSALHIDGGDDNTSETPSAVEIKNDVIFTDSGQLGVGVLSPDSNSVFQTQENEGGLLLPRVALLGATNGTSPINNPAVGLIVYNTNTANLTTTDEVLAKNLYRWNGTEWKMISTTTNLPSPSDPSTIVIKTWDAVDSATYKSLGDFDFRMLTSGTNIKYQIKMNSIPLTTLSINYSFERRIGNDTNGFTGNNGTITFNTTDYSTWKDIFTLQNDAEGAISYLSVLNGAELEFYTLYGYKKGDASLNTSGLKSMVVNKY